MFQSIYLWMWLIHLHTEMYHEVFFSPRCIFLVVHVDHINYKNKWWSLNFIFITWFFLHLLLFVSNKNLALMLKSGFSFPYMTVLSFTFPWDIICMTWFSQDVTIKSRTSCFFFFFFFSLLFMYFIYKLFLSWLFNIISLHLIFAYLFFLGYHSISF